jgi:polar amino acid transport system substrate-binding protein
MRLQWRRPLLALAVVASLSALSACTAFTYSPTPLPSEAPSQQPAPSAPASPAACRDNPLASYAPGGPLPTPETLPNGSTMAKIQKRGRLVAGVSADTYLLGSRNPFTGEIEGFDIDMVKAVAKAIFGNENRYQLKVITAAQRIPALEKGDVDIVARNMTINCDRWKQIAFSTEYYRSGQKILVRKGSKANSLNDLDGQKVCAPIGTSSMDNLIKKAPKVIPVGANTHTGCLVLFQEGQVAAITGDDTVLAGLAAQDPYAVVPDQRAFTEEPYGLGFNEKDVDFVRFVNARLEEMRTDGEWTRIYDRWLRDSLGPAPKPPIPVYGRTR